MALLELVSPWDSQPQEWAEIGGNNPASSGLALLLPLRGSYDLIDRVTGRAASSGSALTTAASTFGTAPLFGSGAWVDFPDPIGISSSTQPVTFSWISEGRSPSSFSQILQWKPSWASASFAIYRNVGFGEYQFTAGPKGVGVGYNKKIGDQNSNVPQRYVLVCRGGIGSGSGADYDLWIDGNLVVAADGNGTYGTNTNNSARIGADWDGTSPFEGLISNFAVWSRALTNSEAASVSANPWQLFQRREWVPFTAGAGGGVTGASSGTLALTGTAAGSIRVSGASAGTLALGGSSAGSVRVTGASAGTLALSGTSTGTVGATGVTGASAGTLALTGTSTGTVRVTGASTGALGLTGSATGSVRVSGASAGTLSLTGTATGNTTGAVSGASVGVLSLSGSATGSARVSGGSAAVLQITGTAGAQIIVRGVSAGVLSMTGSATAVNGDVPAVIVRAALSSRTRIRQDGAGTRPAQRSTGSRPRQ